MLARSHNFDVLLRAFTQVSVLPVIEWYMLFLVARRLDDRAVKRGMAFGSLALIAIISTLVSPQRFAFFLEAFLLFALWLSTPAMRRISIILLLIALQRNFALDPLHGLISMIDARTVSALMALIGHPVLRIGNLLKSSGMPEGLMVLPGCASTNLILPTALGLAALILTSRPRLLPADYRWIVAVSVISLIMNLIRLSLMLNNKAAYLYWHEGTGAALVSAVGMAITLGCWTLATDQRKSRA